MSTMRGVDPFDRLWERRVRLAAGGEKSFDLLSLPDLVRAKKTQRDKDWPMIRRLIEADYVGQENPSIDRVRFWLLESRTTEMLLDLAQTYRSQTEALKNERRVLADVLNADKTAIEEELEIEMRRERDADRQYWDPLRGELESLRQMNFSSRRRGVSK